MSIRRNYPRVRHKLLQEYCEQLGVRTQRRSRINAERAARHAAEASANAKARFIATMSHELRTPLNCMIGFADLLMQPDDAAASQDQRLEYAGYIHESSVHLLKVVNSILEMSKIQSGMMDIELSAVPLAQLAQQCCAQLAPQAADKQVTLECDVLDEAVFAHANETKARQIVLNLLSNAIKFTRPGGKVLASVQLCGEGGASIAVTDSGIGMSQDEMVIALTPFGQVDDGYARKQPGTGLGLSIARELTELMGGRFEIHSKKGEGTRITLTFDLAEPGAEEIDAAHDALATVPS